MERKMNLYGNHIFELLRIIDKLGLTEELSKMFKNIVKNADKEKSLTARLRIALGDKEYTEDNIMKVLSNNKELAKAYAEQQENNIDKTMDILGILIKRIPQAEDEVQALLKDVYGVKKNEKIGFIEEIEMIKELIKNEEIKKGFSLIFK
ncbi:MAG: hypothetical protein E7A11_07620 [Clostridium sp.]|jgi:hypothetical protein|uniref:hypothetical protein n=1 Tax=Clostridium TaxID=1485 RepID=UPI0023309110|nr:MULTISPECIES: hypothetical protein [Clostridium]MDU1095789.1 hypothetical protein [Clostridioides difficile]MDB2071377.1 hypothetical protein [Clostridium paraputrificum]MDB2081710.1 hypothetical protein [Clostridium paraputrificum]MDU1125136.1 hypothetical protein [Clostridium sp.]MDU3676197.1 hypothetical protein [Clostridium sp.]